MGDRGFFNPFRKRRDREQADERPSARQAPAQPPEQAQEEVFALFEDVPDDADELFDAFDEALRAQQDGSDAAGTLSEQGDGALTAGEPEDPAGDIASSAPATHRAESAMQEPQSASSNAEENPGQKAKPLDMVALRRAVFAQNLDETDDESVNRRLNWLVDFMNDEETANEVQGFINDAEERSLNIRLFLDDPVVTALIRSEEIEMAHVMHAVRRQAREPERPLWRVLLDLSEVDHDLVYGEAARLYGTPEVTVNETHPQSGFLSAIIEVFPDRVRERLRQHNLLPLELQAIPDSDDHCLLMATHDPSNDATQAFVNGLGLPIALRYAPQADVARRLDRVMPPRTHASGEQSELWNALMPPDELFDAEPVDGDQADEDASFVAGSDTSQHPLETSSFEDEEAFVSGSEQFAEVASEGLEQGGLEDEPWNENFEDDLTTFEPQHFDDPTAAEASQETDAAMDLDWSVIDDETFDELSMALLDEIEAETTDGEADEPERASTGRAGKTDTLHSAASNEPDLSKELEPTGLEAAPETEQSIDDESMLSSEASPEEPETIEVEESVLMDSQQAETSTSQGGQEYTTPRNQGGMPEEGGSTEVRSKKAGAPADEPKEPADRAAMSPVESESAGESTIETTGEKGDEVPQEVPVEAVSEAELKEITSKDRVIAMLVRKAVVTPRDVKQAQIKQKEERSKDALWRVLARINGVPREAIFREAARMYAFPEAQVGEGKPDPEFARSVMDTFEEESRDELLKLRVVPYEVDLEQQTGAIKVVFITHDPTRPEVHKMMQKLKLERFELRYAPESVVTMLIAEAFPRRNEFLDRLADDHAVDLGTAYQSSEGADLVDEDALEAEINRSKLINLFEATLVEAVRQGASDIHIWPNAKRQVEIHFRLDGRLQRWHLEDKVHPEALIAVIKDNSMNVDRFERDAAQDGFIQRWIDEALIRFRVSVLPIANAANDVRSESIVIRVLDDRKVIKDLSLLGLDKTALSRFAKAIRQPHGMVILTGPTGSGKTTTLYAALHEVVSPELNVLTVEDPVEYILPGVRQIKLNHKLGLSSALRSILRHDPDVVMVGEMRDRQTAELAIKLANTGHLTFSTLHTNDAASAISRLYKMGIEPFLIAYAINLVVAQRLIRLVCPSCKQPEKPKDVDYVLLKNLGFSDEEREQIQRGELVICQPGSDTARERCQTCRGVGYKGRRAVSEALYFSRRIRHIIADASDRGLDEQGVKDVAREEGMLTLLDSAREVVKAGQTTVDELLRVIASED